MRGRIMTGFVRVAPEGYRTEGGLKKWVTRGVDFVVTMPSAPSTKKGARRKVREQRRTK
jgi:hypothetical protein